VIGYGFSKEQNAVAIYMNFHSPKIYSHKEITDNQRRIHKNMFCLVWTIFVLLGMYRALHKLSLRIIIELDLS
jgi:hypothetical protein